MPIIICYWIRCVFVNVTGCRRTDGTGRAHGEVPKTHSIKQIKFHSRFLQIERERDRQTDRVRQRQ